LFLTNHSEVDAIQRTYETPINKSSQELETNNNVQSSIVDTEESNNGQENVDINDIQSNDEITKDTGIDVDDVEKEVNHHIAETDVDGNDVSKELNDYTVEMDIDFDIMRENEYSVMDMDIDYAFEGDENREIVEFQGADALVRIGGNIEDQPESSAQSVNNGMNGI
jgi:hypothetical protein